MSDDRFHLYFSNPSSMQVIDSTGRPMMFVGGRFHTKDPAQIAMLDQMVESGNGSIFKNPDQLTASADELNPEAVYKKRIIEEYLREQNAFLDPNNTYGDSIQSPLKGTSTTDIAAVTLGGRQVLHANATNNPPPIEEQVPSEVPANIEPVKENSIDTLISAQEHTAIVDSPAPATSIQAALDKLKNK